MKTYVITFYSHFSAIGFHKAMKKIGVNATLMPIPRHLSSSCGTCVKAYWNDSIPNDIKHYDGIEKVFQITEQDVIMVYES